MLFRILKKDLKRKRTMNVILLLFIILASTFISSSVNNLITITTALEGYFEEAGLYDFIIATLNNEENDAAIQDFLDRNEHVEGWVQDENLYFTKENIKLHNNREFSLPSSGMICSYNMKQQEFFNHKNEKIVSMGDGEIYMPSKLMEDNGLEVGDRITFTNNGLDMEFTITDYCKDAFLGSTMMGSSRLIVSDHAYAKISENFNPNFFGKIYSIDSSDVKALRHDYNQEGFNVLFACDHNVIATSYVMDMVIAGVLLIVSICLILISLVILRFTIVFTLQEEFREIGVMKAIGIQSSNIRGLYIIKYLAVSVVGSLLGFLLSIPFGKLFTDQISRNIILSNGVNGLLINLLCSAAIVIIVILFSYSCTHHVNRFSPIQAIRNGSDGERFKRKGFLRLGKCNLPAVWFMALNNILSGLKRYGALIITFTIGIILVIVPINTVNTLSSDKLVNWFGMAESDVYLVNDSEQMSFMTSGGRNKIKEVLVRVENTLKNKGIPTSVFNEMMFRYKITLGDYGYNSLAIQGTGIAADQYSYTTGEAPKYENEVALTHITAEEIGATIGDTVKIKTGDTEQEYIVTALFQSMNNMGEGIRFSEKAKLDYQYAGGFFPIQIRYQDHPSKEEEQRRFEEIKKIFPDYEVTTGSEYITEMMGDVAGQVDRVKQIIVIVIVAINMLVAILMVKTFITKEKGEIGMLKSIGFRDGAIMKWQVLRIGIILIISAILGTLLSTPISQISSGKVFEMMGASHIEFVIKPLEVFIIYPLVILIFTLVASTITALQISNVSVKELNNIE